MRLLLVRTSAAWDFPNGRPQTGETEFAAAQREVAEETGLADLDFPFGDAHRDALPSPGGTIASYYLAETDEAEIPAAPGEWRWVSFDEAEDFLPPRLALVLDWACATIEGR